MDKADPSQIQELKEAFVCLFEKLTPAARLGFVYGITTRPDFFGNTVEEVCAQMYTRVARDTVYYGLMSQRLNRCFM